MGEKKMIFTLNVDGYAKAWPYVQALILSEASYLAPVKQAAARLFNISLRGLNSLAFRRSGF